MIHFFLILFLCSILVQVYLFISMDRGMSAGVRETPAFNLPVSVVIAAHNEEDNLPGLLESLENQDYPDYEVILVNDRSTDQTPNIAENYEHVRVIEVEETPSEWDPKKYALDCGIRSARNEYLLLIDADCRPATDRWIKSMASKFNQAEVVIGISPFNPHPTVLGEFIQYEYLLTAWQYISRAMNKNPYMAVGRNLGYKKVVFIDNNGFESFKGKTGGDDDLLINGWSDKVEMVPNIEKEAWVYTEGKKDWGSFLRQKLRHLSAGLNYRWKDRLNLGMFIGSLVIFWISAIVLLFSYSHPYLIILGIISRFIVMLPAVWIAKRALGSKFRILNLFILDFIYMLYYITTSFKVLLAKRIRWT